MAKKKYVSLDNLGVFADVVKSKFAQLNHKHTKSDITDFPTIPSKTSELVNDSGFKTTDNNTTYVLNGALNGDVFINTLKPSSGSNTTSTIPSMTAASSTSNGKAGLVPAPASGKQNSFLRGDGTWVVPTDTKYTHPTTSGNKHIPSGGSSGQILRWSADGTAVWGNDNDTTYSAAGSSLGLVKSGGDVTISSGVITVNDDSHAHTIDNIDNLQGQLDSKAAASHNHAASNINSGTLSSDRLPTVPIAKGGTGATTAAAALTNLGITATASELNILDGVTATTTELNYVDGVTSNIQTQLNGKAASSHTHNVLSVQSDNYKQGTDLPSTYPRGETIFFSNNPTNKFNGMSYCTVHTIKGYNNMVCIQYVYPYNSDADTIYYRTALYNSDAWRDWKTVSTSEHTHSYAASSSIGGSATSAVKLDSSAGSVTQPIYFSGGKPVATTYALNKTVPADAKFTDTTYSAGTGISLSGTTFNHSNSVTAGSATEGGSARTLAFGGTFNIPSINYDAQGHITGKGSITLTMPANPNTDTKNTAGSSDSSSKLFLIGATSQATNPQTYSHDTAYVDTNGHLYSNSKQVVNLSDTQALTNKTYNGYTLAAACAKGVTDSSSAGAIGTGTNLVTERDVYYGLPTINNSHSYTSSTSIYAPTAGGTANYVLIGAGTTTAPTWTAQSNLSAGTAAKLATARSIGLGGDLTGSTTFDGSANITISAKYYNTAVNSGNKSNYPYHRFAYKGSKASPITSQYNDTDAIFCIREAYNAGGYGILKISLRTNASTSVSQATATWLARYNFDLSDVQIGLYDVAGATYADLYIKVGTYARTTVTQLEGNRSWTLVSSSEVNDTTTSDAKTSTECYATIEAAATVLHGQAYTSIISSVDGGKVAESAKLGSSTVGSATQPIYLNNGTATKCTYTLGKSVPSDAVFTDTNTKVTNTLATTTKAYVTGTTSASTNTGTQVFDTGVYLDTTAGQLTATTFNGTTFSGSGVATVSEVKTYLGI